MKPWLENTHQKNKLELKIEVYYSVHALEPPKQSAFGEDAYPDIFSKAAALYASLAQNHSFHNANKRTALFLLILFLWLNRYRFIAPQKVAEDYTVFVVNEKPEIECIVKFIEEWTETRWTYKTLHLFIIYFTNWPRKFLYFLSTKSKGFRKLMSEALNKIAIRKKTCKSPASLK